MKVQEIVDRVLRDPKFAAELTTKVSALSASGSVRHEQNGDGWQDVLKHFADGPDELAQLSSVNSPVAGSSWWTTTVTTVTTTSATPTAPVTVTSMTTMTTATQMVEE